MRKEDILTGCRDFAEALARIGEFIDDVHQQFT
jgi:hypothetical protein